MLDAYLLPVFGSLPVHEYSREEIQALIRHEASEQDAAIYATAATTGPVCGPRPSTP